jgi:hypothetical protein
MRQRPDKLVEFRGYRGSEDAGVCRPANFSENQNASGNYAGNIAQMVRAERAKQLALGSQIASTSRTDVLNQIRGIPRI